MRRRRLLEAVGLGGATLLAGCGGTTTPADESGGGDTPGGGGTTDGGGGVEPTDDGGGPDAVREGRLGEVVESETISMVARETRTEPDMGPYTTPESGNEFLVVRLAIKNTTDGEFASFLSLLQPRVTDPAGDTYEQTTAGQTDTPLTGGQVAPGEVARGDVVFEVPRDATGLSLELDVGALDVVDLDRVVVDLSSSAGSPADLSQDLAVPLAGVGDAVTSAGTTVTLHGFSTSDEIGFGTADDGNQFAVVDVSVTNETGEAKSVSTRVLMLGKAGSGLAYPVSVEAQDGLDQAFAEDSPLADGQTRRGKVAYEVPEDARPLYWTFAFGLFAGGEKAFWQLR
jgi:hypothetical protein